MVFIVVMHFFLNLNTYADETDVKFVNVTVPDAENR